MLLPRVHLQPPTSLSHILPLGHFLHPMLTKVPSLTTSAAVHERGTRNGPSDSLGVEDRIPPGEEERRVVWRGDVGDLGGEEEVRGPVEGAL